MGEGTLCCGLFCLTVVAGWLDGGSVVKAIAKKTTFLYQCFLENLKCVLHKNKSREVQQENPFIKEISVIAIIPFNFFCKSFIEI